jgi:hypothetical protein
VGYLCHAVLPGNYFLGDSAQLRSRVLPDDDLSPVKLNEQIVLLCKEHMVWRPVVHVNSSVVLCLRVCTCM